MNHNIVTQDDIQRAWNALRSGDWSYAHDILKPFIFSNKDELRWLQNYDFPELIGVDEKTRRHFSRLIVWNRLLGTWKQHRHVWIKRHWLGAILGTPYELRIDTSKMRLELYGERGFEAQRNLPVKGGEAGKTWPELYAFHRLPLSARTAFTLMVRHADTRSGLCSPTRIGPVDVTELANSITILREAGLIETKPSERALLHSCTVAQLSQIASGAGLSSNGPKSRIIDSILQGFTSTQRADIFHDLYGSGLILLKVTKLSILKKLLLTEVERVELLISWLIRIKHKGEKPRTEEERRERAKSSRLEPWSNLDPRYAEIPGNLAATIWTDTYDKIIIKLALTYKWYAPWYFAKHIANLMSTIDLEDFKRRCEATDTLSWDTLIRLFGIVRLEELGIHIPEPRVRKCPGCQESFKEWSVPLSLAERIDFNILFCAECYKDVFWQHPRPTKKLDRDRLLQTLRDLAGVMETVPLRELIEKPNVIGLNNEKHIRLVRALQWLAPQEQYRKEFGSWFSALVEAGILEDGTMRTSRGIRCVANDGHECHSLAERVIDDWLDAHGIPHEREPEYPYHFHLNPNRMRADWQVESTFIEYAGLIDEPDYAAKIEVKRQLAELCEIDLLVITPSEILELDEVLKKLKPE